MSILRIGFALGLLSALAACQSPSGGRSDQAPATPSPVAQAPAEPGIAAFAQAACGGCHAVKAGMLSPNPASPGFAEIANRAGLTQGSLGTWLRDAHNYPEDMDFDLDPAQVEALVAYILSLREADYRPPIS
jgi:mono/diheme cytochrome c family protein